MNETGRELTAAIGLALIWCGVLGMIAVLVFTGLAASHDGFTYKCLVEGPYPEPSAGAILTEAAQPAGRFSLWPLGRACDWEDADGQRSITALPDWTATVTFLSCASSAVLGRALRTVAGLPLRSSQVG
ncbi:hypothetical protein DF223_00670 [Mycetocola zhujimingii]|uniref:Uncharacterized protein n=1 Tax=Mycetocola zhujimingii TaxID=2079792 RepID=A0A2U1TG94_9MICO|nr:hypothetical protein DF223_00670 [Mycetocola zhujimingii]